MFTLLCPAQYSLVNEKSKMTQVWKKATCAQKSNLYVKNHLHAKIKLADSIWKHLGTLKYACFKMHSHNGALYIQKSKK